MRHWLGPWTFNKRGPVHSPEDSEPKLINHTARQNFLLWLAAAGGCGRRCRPVRVRACSHMHVVSSDGIKAAQVAPSRTRGPAGILSLAHGRGESARPRA